MNDCLRAIQFVRHNAAKWKIDPQRIGVTGGSAGGHLSLWVALHDDAAEAKSNDPVARQSSRVACAVSFAGPTDWSLLIPYPGTSVWKYPGRFGYTIVNPDFTEYVQMGRDGRTCYALQHKNFTPQDVQRWMQMAAQTLMAGGARHMSESRVAQ